MDIYTWTDSRGFQFFQWHFNLKGGLMDLRRNLNMPMTSIDTNARKDWVALHHWELQPTSANLPAGWLTNCTIRSPRATNLFCFPGFSNLMSVPKNYGSWQGLQFILCKIQALANFPNSKIPEWPFACWLWPKQGLKNPHKNLNKGPWPMNLLLPSHLPS